MIILIEPTKQITKTKNLCESPLITLIDLPTFAIELFGMPRSKTAQSNKLNSEVTRGGGLFCVF